MSEQSGPAQCDEISPGRFTGDPEPGNEIAATDAPLPARELERLALAQRQIRNAAVA